MLPEQSRPLAPVPGLRAGAPPRSWSRGDVRAQPVGLRHLVDGSVRGQRPAGASARACGQHWRANPGLAGSANGRRQGRVMALLRTVAAAGAPVVASQDHAHGHGTRRRLLASVHDEQGHLASEHLAPATQRPREGGGPQPGTGRPRRDRPARWLTASMLSLAVLAAASATVSYAAQYRMVLAAKDSAPAAALEAAIPDVAALIFATLGDRAGAARQAGDPGTGAERRGGGHVGDHERAGRRSRVAGPGGLGDAPDRVRAGVRHRDRRGPGMDDRPAEGAERDAGRR